jgi:hypothetical protein
MGEAAIRVILMELEKIWPSINEMGADFLEHAGQTVFQVLGPDGKVRRQVIYVGPRNGLKTFALNWREVEIIPSSSPQALIAAIVETAKERAWLQ